jgi:hypothetical protein
MTLSTIRGSIGRVRNMYLFMTNVVASSDIAFYIASTHGRPDIGKEILGNIKTGAEAMVALYFSEQIPITAAETVGWSFLMGAWADYWAFMMGSVDVLNVSIGNSTYKKPLCKWTADNSTTTPVDTGLNNIPSVDIYANFANDPYTVTQAKDYVNLGKGWNKTYVSSLSNNTTYPVSDVDSKYETWPSIEQLEDGTLIAVYRTTDNMGDGFDTSGRKVMRKSADKGLTWSDENIIAKDLGNYDCCDGGILVYYRYGIETILHTFSKFDGQKKDVYVHYSSDAGVTWSTPVLVQKNATTSCNPIYMHNKEMAFITYSFNVEGTNNINVAISKDYGTTWQYWAILNDSENQINETTLLEVSENSSYNGGVIAVSRLETTGHYMILKSSDYAYSFDTQEIMDDWSETYQTRPMLRRIYNDLIMLIYTTNQNGDIAWRLSSDEGVTWGDATVIIGTGWMSVYPDVISIYSDYNLGVIWATNTQNPNQDSDVFITLVDKYDNLS